MLEFELITTFLILEFSVLLPTLAHGMEKDHRWIHQRFMGFRYLNPPSSKFKKTKIDNNSCVHFLLYF